MASTSRQTSRDLIDRLSAEPYGFHFYQAMRMVECLHGEKPRLGTSQRPGDDPIRLRQDPDLTFESASLCQFHLGGENAPHRLTQRFFGLLGPNGPLPLHLTEYAQERLRKFRDHTFARFLDVFHHRMTSLLYRAWANNEPTVSFDRPLDDRFAIYVASLAGLGMEGLRNRDALEDLTKLYFTGRLACQAKHPEGLQAMVAEYFRLPVKIQEFIGAWMQLPADSICHLGETPVTGTLGMSAIVGDRVWGAQQKFRIRLGALSFVEYETLLPGGTRIERLVALVRNYAGDEWAWDSQLLLKREEVPIARLDGAFRLGWTTWIGERNKPADADDLILNAFRYVTL